MRNHFEHELFQFPPFPPHFGPWDGFGPFCGRRTGWPNFNRPGCRPHGPPGFTNCFGPPHHRRHDRHRSPSPPSEPEGPRFPFPFGHHGGRHDRCKSPGHHGFPRCGRGPQIGHHGDHENERCTRGFEKRCGPGQGAKGGHHHHHWPFGPDNCEPHWGPRLGHRRQGPYGRPSGCNECEDCRNEPCCPGNKDAQTSNKAGTMRKKNTSCCARNKNQDESGDTVLVQRIIVERAPTRPKSI